MAEYVKFRLSAAKVGVTMALAALVAGAVERAGAGASSLHVRPAALFVKLGGINGELHKVLSKIEIKIEAVGAEVASLEKKFHNKVYTKVEADKIYLKIRTANGEFLKKADTAANSQLLGNKPASSFVQGNRTSVVTGAATLGPASSAQTLLQIPSATQGGIIVVCEPVPGAGTQAVLQNNTGKTLPAVQTVGGQSKSVPLSPGNNLLLGNMGGTGQTTIQILPTTGFSEVVTLVVSAEPSIQGNNQTAFVAQAFTGGV